MTADEMLAEARSIVRPCVYLTDVADSGPLAAVWKGHGLFLFREPSYRHWLTIDCSIVPENFADLGLCGAVSIYASTDGETGRCFFDSQRASVSAADGTPLFGRPGLSLPTVDQLLRWPTPRIQEWMRKVGCGFVNGSWVSTDESRAVCLAYSQHVAAEDPARQSESEIFAVLGGWPVEVYEDDWALTVNDPKARQFVFTYAESEPLLQVWVAGDGAFHVRQIIS